MADKYQKDSKAASFKKHKEIPAGSGRNLDVSRGG